MSRSSSESMLSHLIRADKPPKQPLSRVAPRSPRLASWSSFSELAIVDDRLNGLLRSEKVAERRQRIHRNAAAVRDYEAGRSPPPNVKNARARAAVLLNSFDMSIDDVRDKLSTLPPIAAAPGSSSALGQSQSMQQLTSKPAAASSTPLAASGSRQAPYTVGGACGGGAAGLSVQCGTPLFAGTIPAQPYTYSSAPTMHGSCAGTHGTQPKTCGVDSSSSGGWQPRSQRPSREKLISSSEGARETQEQGAAGDGDELLSKLAVPAASLGPIASWDMGSIRNLAEKDVGSRGHAGKDRRPKGENERLEVITGLQEQGAIREKARSSLYMSDTLQTRGSLQRRELLPPSQQSAAMQYALLSPRNANLSPKQRRRSAHAEAAATAAAQHAKTSAANAPGGVAAAEQLPQPKQQPNMAACHNAALDNVHSATTAALERPPGIQLRQRPSKEGKESGKEGGKESGKEAKGGKPRSALVVEQSAAVAAPAPVASPVRRVNFAGANGVPTPADFSAPQSRFKSSRRTPLGPTLVEQPPVWQVANRVGDEFPEGMPAIEVEGHELASLPTDSLIWTEGLEDWLPMGELPPVSALPPAPMKASEDGRGSPAHGGSPRTGRTSPS